MSDEWPLPDIDAALIRDFDLFNVEPIGGDLYAGWKKWQEGPRLFYTPKNGGHWVATRAEDIYNIYRDTEKFSNHGVALFREQHGTRFIPGEIDPPDHTAFRSVLNPEFSPRRVRDLEDDARELAIELIEGVRGDGECEFREAVALRVPIYNFLNFLKLPRADAALLLPAADTIARDSNMTNFMSAMGVISAYIDARIEERLDERIDDFIGRLTHAMVGGRPITRDEIRVTTLNVLLGGLDTVTASMGFFMDFLSKNPAHRQLLAQQPELIPDAVEELLRRHGIFNTGRLVQQEYEFGGVTLRRHDLILIPTALHNLDERRFPDPLEVDFRRADKNHLTFGAGIHRCLGSNFARAQLKILLEEWLARIPDFAPKAGTTAKVQSGRANTVTELMLSW
jgi:cytochrome P450